MFVKDLQCNNGDNGEVGHEETNGMRQSGCRKRARLGQERDTAVLVESCK